MRDSTMANQTPPQNIFLPIIILILVSGSLGLAIADENYRPTFADLAKIGVGSYIGWKTHKLDPKKHP